MVHRSRSRLQALESFIGEACVPARRASFDISSLKRDGTVFVRFRSVGTIPALHLVRCFSDSLQRAGKRFERTTDVQFRLALDQF